MSEAGTTEKWISRLTLGGIVLGLAAQQFWYVPFYLESKVRAQVTAELQSIDHVTVERLAETNQAQVGAVLTRLDGIEVRMIERDKMFMQFLTAERARRLASNE